MIAPSTTIHAYRHLYRELLHAVRYATPARHVARDQLRKAFREGGDKAKFDPEGVKRTLWFLRAASKEAGMEHKILKNLLRVAWHRADDSKKRWKGGKQEVEAWKRGTESENVERELAYRHYDRTVEMVNKTMGTCLR